METKTSVLLDSSVIISFYNDKDQNHQKAINLSKELFDGTKTILISDYIFDECITVILQKEDINKAIKLGEYLLNSQIVDLRINESTLEFAWEYFKTKNPGKLSFTDCVNIACLNLLNIDYLATFDKEFSKVRGIRVIS